MSNTDGVESGSTVNLEEEYVGEYVHGLTASAAAMDALQASDLHRYSSQPGQ